MAIPAPKMSTTVSGVKLKGVNAEFFRTLMARIEEEPQIIRDVYAIPEKSEGAEENFAQYTSIPAWELWPYGEPRTYRSLGEVTLNVVHKRFQHGLSWAREDRLDDRIGDLNKVAQSAARKYVTLRREILIQMMTGSSSIRLLPFIPPAYDGSAFFRSTAGSLGGTTGNIINGFGFTTPSDVIDSIYFAIETFMSFQDTEGEQYWYDEDCNISNLRFFARAANLKVWNEVMKSSVIPAGVTSSAIVDNPFLQRGQPAQVGNFYFTPQITDNSIYVYNVADPQIKPWMHLPREEPQSFEKKAETGSDLGIDYGMEALAWLARYGSSPVEPRCGIKILNT